jgi:hypothetical protein
LNDGLTVSVCLIPAASTIVKMKGPSVSGLFVFDPLKITFSKRFPGILVLPLCSRKMVGIIQVTV